MESANGKTRIGFRLEYGIDLAKGKTWSRFSWNGVGKFLQGSRIIMVFKIPSNRDPSVILPSPPSLFPRLWSLLACSSLNFQGGRKKSPLCPVFHCSAGSHQVSTKGSDGSDGSGGCRVHKAWKMHGSMVPILPGLRRGQDLSCGRTAGVRAARLQGQEGSLD